MHHLGHLFLAERTGGFQFGAFIADGVRAQRLKELPPEVRLGVQFHRWVDWQTDRHPAFLEARRLLRPAAGRYAGLIADLWLDVALGRMWNTLSEKPLEAFEGSFLRESLQPYRIWAPGSWHAFLESMEKDHLLLQFASAEGMLRHLERFILRRNLPLESRTVRRLIEQQYDALMEQLKRFWREAHGWRRTPETFTPNP